LKSPRGSGCTTDVGFADDAADSVALPAHGPIHPARGAQELFLRWKTGGLVIVEADLPDVFPIDQGRSAIAVEAQTMMPTIGEDHANQASDDVVLVLRARPGGVLQPLDAVVGVGSGLGYVDPVLGRCVEAQSILDGCGSINDVSNAGLNRLGF